MNYHAKAPKGVFHLNDLNTEPAHELPKWVLNAFIDGKLSIVRGYRAVGGLSGLAAALGEAPIDPKDAVSVTVLTSTGPMKGSLKDTLVLWPNGDFELFSREGFSERFSRTLEG